MIIPEIFFNKKIGIIYQPNSFDQKYINHILKNIGNKLEIIVLKKYYKNLNTVDDLLDIDKVLFNKIIDKYFDRNPYIYFKKYLIEFSYDTQKSEISDIQLSNYSKNNNIEYRTELRTISYKIQDLWKNNRKSDVPGS